MRTTISQVVGGKLYDVKTAVLVASNEYWDGHSWERQGRNKHLYKTSKGAFFVVFSTLYQGEKNYIEPVNFDEARRLYEELSEDQMDYFEAFGIEPEEA